MRKRNALLAAVIGATMALSGAAFSGVTEGNGNGNPDTTPSGKCPGGQNKDTSPGGLKKCD
jgi:hypothetical protein